MGDYIKDLALSRQEREAHSNINKELGTVYQSHRKGFTNCGNAKHIAECYQTHVGVDPDLTAMLKARTKKEQYFYLNRYLERWPECKIDPHGQRIHQGITL